VHVKSVVPKSDRAGSREVESSTAALTTRVMALLTLAVVVPVPQQLGWSGSCSNCCTRQHENELLWLLSVTWCLYIWPELSTGSGFSCFFLILSANLLCSHSAMGCN